MTDNELKEALKNCTNACAMKCKLCRRTEYGCRNFLMQSALDLINQQKEEIERYHSVVGKLVVKDKEVVGVLHDKKTTFIEKAVATAIQRMAVKDAKKDAIKEFARNLKCGVPYDTGVIRCKDIDNLLKEKVGEEK